MIAVGAGMLVVGLSLLAWRVSRDAGIGAVTFLLAGGLAVLARPIVTRWYRRTPRNEEPTFSWTILLAMVAGLFVLISYRWNPGGPVTWQTIVALLLLAGAAMLTGLLVGFLFGIPRVVKQANARTADRFTTNTNLEEVSDWLTKIIIGVGLVEARELGNVFDALITSVAAEGIGSKPVVGSILVFFVVAGFLDGYLWTRIILTRRLTLSERELIEGVQPQVTTQQPAPEQPAPEQPAPEQPAPEQPAPEQPAPEQPAPDQPAAGAG